MRIEATYSGVIGWLSWFCSALNAQASVRVEGRRMASGKIAFPLAYYGSWSEKRVELGLLSFRGQQARTPKLLPPSEPFPPGPALAIVPPVADANFTR